MNIVALSGWKGSGKDMVANYLVEKWGFQRVSFADPLKDEVARKWKLPRSWMDDLAFKEKPLLPYWANLGMHLLNKKIKFPNSGSLESDVLPKLASSGKLKAFKHTGHWITINTMKELEEAGNMLKSLGL